MNNQPILTAAEAANVKTTKTVSLENVMYSVQNASNNGRGSITYDVRYEVFEDGVVERLIELGYSVTVNKYDTSAFINVTWETDEQRKARIEANMPKALRS